MVVVFRRWDSIPFDCCPYSVLDLPLRNKEVAVVWDMIVPYCYSQLERCEHFGALFYHYYYYYSIE